MLDTSPYVPQYLQVLLTIFLYCETFAPRRSSLVETLPQSIYNQSSLKDLKVTFITGHTNILSVNEKLLVSKFLYFGNIQYSSLATLTFMFLVNGKPVWRDKTVTRALEL